MARRKPGSVPTAMQRGLAHKATQPVRHPTLDEFVALYGGLDAARRLAEIEDLDAQLDTVWPGWRQKAAFGHLPYESLIRVKTLLVRRELVLAGNSEWGVKIIHKTQANGRKTKDGKPWPYAMAIPPVEVPHIAEIPEVAARFGPRISIPHLAASCKLPIEVVEEAEANRPRDAINARDWAIAYAARKAAAAAPKKKQTSKKRAHETTTDGSDSPRD